jgi:hypothetical protein
MISALPAAWVVRGTVVAVTLACWAVVYRSSPTAAGAILTEQGTIITGVNAVIFLLTIPPVFRFLHKLTLAHLWWFPLLDGEWDVELWSNWPRVQAMLAAARGDAPHFDALADELPDGAATPIRMTATIESSLFEIEMIMRVPGTERCSRTAVVRPRRSKPPSMTYVYEQTDHAPVAVTDVPQHLGAGVLTYDKVTGELRGQYWTQRQAARGLNTAGSLILRRRGQPA